MVCQGSQQFLRRVSFNKAQLCGVGDCYRVVVFMASTKHIQESLYRWLAIGTIAKCTPSVRYASEWLTYRSKLILDRDYTLVAGQHSSRALAGPRECTLSTFMDADMIA